MAYFKINSLDHLQELTSSNFHPNGHVERKFELNGNNELVRPLIENYLDNFAFGFKFNKKVLSVFKENGEFFIRNNKEFKFEFPHCPPPVSTLYSLRTNSIDEVVEFLLEGGN